MLRSWLPENNECNNSKLAKEETNTSILGNSNKVTTQLLFIMSFKTLLKRAVDLYFNNRGQYFIKLVLNSHFRSVKDLARLSLKDPVYVSVHEHSQHSTPSQLQQNYMVCDLHQKLDLLWSFVKNHLKSKILVFIQSCKQVFIYSFTGLPRHRENREFESPFFPDRENTGNLLKNIKNVFLHREFTTNTGKI